MERRKPLKRGRPLRADPEKVREFLRRDRPPRAEVEKVREFLRRGKGLRSQAKARVEREGPLSPAEWRQQAFVASGGVCIISGARARHADDRRFHAHHVVPARVLRARGFLDRVWDPRNSLWLHRDVHMRHESAAERVPAQALPGCVWEFARELDALERTEWATQLVLRAHPPAERRTLSAEEDDDGEGRGDGR